MTWHQNENPLLGDDFVCELDPSYCQSDAPEDLFHSMWFLLNSHRIVLDSLLRPTLKDDPMDYKEPNVHEKFPLQSHVSCTLRSAVVSDFKFFCIDLSVQRVPHLNSQIKQTKEFVFVARSEFFKNIGFVFFDLSKLVHSSEISKFFFPKLEKKIQNSCSKIAFGIQNQSFLSILFT